MGVGGLLDSAAGSFWVLEAPHLPRASRLFVHALGGSLSFGHVYGCELAALACCRFCSLALIFARDDVAIGCGVDSNLFGARNRVMAGFSQIHAVERGSRNASHLTGVPPVTPKIKSKTAP